MSTASRARQQGGVRQNHQFPSGKAAARRSGGERCSSSATSTASFSSSSCAATRSSTGGYSSSAYSSSDNHYYAYGKHAPEAPPKGENELKSKKATKKKKKKMASAAAAEEEDADGVGVAVEKESCDPRADFRESMVQMVVEMGLCDWDGLRCMLRRLLALNAPRHHAAILTAFAEVCAQIIAAPAAAASSPSPKPGYQYHRRS
ncbi:hypothetical protein PR202_gb16373 [Eleusine coracana subsp. coracana]|uniref:Transcription repressor n=1 Tax=Eleusine coracana subsp. coracana TaxID=191504 RepID=A0AAV5F0Q3_ELECO|nr:hypothetical protein PR202_gb16373 [Eleusine coracana subsp. coracana]